MADEALKRSDFAAYRAELEEHIKKFALGVKREQGEVEEILGEILDRLNALEAAAAPGASTGGHLPWSLRATERDWQDLADWIDWLGRHYAPQLHLRVWPCWPAHGGVVEELAALRAAWCAAVEADADPVRSGSELAYWHQMWLWPTVERIRQNYMFSECETDHSPDRPGRPTDADALRARVAGAEAERLRLENAPYAFFAEVPPGFSPDRPDGLWRCAGDDWEYLSLLDWEWHAVEKPPVKREILHELTAERALELAADRRPWVTYWAHYTDESDWRAGAEPTTVVRRRRSPERVLDEAYGPDGAWEPTDAVHDFLSARPSDPPHLVEIDATEAARLANGDTGL
ncbi:hypothetical protein [Streptomyces sp. UNOB3_S3]|uniref:hypothetical protein n=1 Tax=Streptomyces sp. UNOB3_S3 TaxID=2871682 RepID=UPI001E49D01D|nr:hypothetical protein [Streptomyces sp. UNOB3_S3]MCC3777577.1 hypothetical protein [Streptomyces sp. UNOB3_S3]